MALVVRIDVDRPYGKQGFVRHVASRVAADLWLPRISWLRYLAELETILRILGEHGRQSFVFFRKCSYPSDTICRLMESGGHQFGLHLENSRTEETFTEELASLQRALGRPISAFSKHGSGDMKLGLHHDYRYQPDRYLPWARKAGIKYFYGNWEDPRLRPSEEGGLVYYPSAFWLEPTWRDKTKFPIEWLLEQASQRDVVLLLHADNVTADPEIMREFLVVVKNLESTLTPASS
jgi:hypothetical protein